MRATRISAVLIGLSAALCIAVVVELDKPSGSLSVLGALYAISIGAAVAAIVVVGVSGPRRRGLAVTAAVAIPLILTHGIWSFVAVWKTSTSWGAPVDCSTLGIESPSHLESHMFPTAVWCVSDATGARATVTSIGDVIVMSVALALITAASLSIAVYLWRISERVPSEEQVRTA